MPQERLSKQDLLAKQIKKDQLDDLELDGSSTLRILNVIALLKSLLPQSKLF